MTNDTETLIGMVVKGSSGIYDVHTNNGTLRCTLRGKLKKAFAEAQNAKSVGKMHLRYDKMPTAPRSQQIERRETSAAALPKRLTVGDYVKLRQLDANTGVIEEILPRQSALSRKDAASNVNRPIEQTMLANLDQVVIVFAATQPEPHFGMLDRYLAICESAGLRPIICINKVDLPYNKQVEEALTLYRQFGYTVIYTSSKTGEGIDTLHSLLKAHTSIFTGPSGVGKSSLINVIEPVMALKTGLVSNATGKGRHTTTGSQLFLLSQGGWLADSAGIRALATWNIAPEDLAWCFAEFRPYLGECLYSDCLHIGEEGCAIRKAVDDHLINMRRYNSYIRIATDEER